MKEEIKKEDLNMRHLNLQIHLCIIKLKEKLLLLVSLTDIIIP